LSANQTIKSDINWSEVHSWRQSFRKKFPRVQKLPVIDSLAAWLIPQIIKRAGEIPSKKVSVLDVGAGKKDLLKKIARVEKLISYKSQDIDKTQSHDFYDIDSIDENFDFVISAEVIEHLDATEKIRFINNLFRLTKPGGYVAVATPNANHPNIFWRDFTHKMPIHYYDLAGLLGNSGFDEIEIFRLTKMNWKKKFTAWRYKALLELLHTDFAQSILAIGKKSVSAL